MKRVGKNSVALGLVMLLISAALAFSANGAPGDVAQSESSAITATGLTGLVDSDECLAESPTGAANNGSGTCGVGLGVSQPAVASFDQTASTDLDGNKGRSTADAAIAETGIDALTTVDLSDLENDVLGIDTGTVLDDVVQGLEPVILRPAFVALLTPLLTQIQDAALTPVLAALQDQIPVSVIIRGVTSTCDATAGSPTTGSSSIAGIDIVVELPAGDLVVPVDLDTSVNAALIGSVAPQELVNGLLDGIEDTLNDSLDGVLGPLAALVGTIQDQLVNAILDQVGPALLDPVGDALGPILDGTVNKQETLPDGSLEVTALDVDVLENGATLALARTKCGPNTLVAADDNDDDGAAAAAAGDGPSDADNNDNDADVVADADSDSQADAVAGSDNDAVADADVTTTLPNAGGSNVLPLILLALGLIGFGAAVLINERRRMMQQV